MPYWNRQETYRQDKAVLAFPDHNAAPFNVTILDSSFGLNERNEKAVPAGHFVCKVGSEIRFLPRSDVQTTAAGTSLVVDNAYVFKVGDAVEIFSKALTTSLDSGFTGVLSTTITAINYATKTLTLANAHSGVTAGTHAIGVVPDEVYGIYPNSADFTKAPSIGVGVFDRAAGVYRNNIPYYDSGLDSYFGRLLNVKVKF